MSKENQSPQIILLYFLSLEVSEQLKYFECDLPVCRGAFKNPLNLLCQALSVYLQYLADEEEIFFKNDDFLLLENLLENVCKMENSSKNDFIYSQDWERLRVWCRSLKDGLDRARVVFIPNPLPFSDWIEFYDLSIEAYKNYRKQSDKYTFYDCDERVVSNRPED